MATFREPRGEERKPPQFALATETDRAIDLSCRACGAMAIGAGLGFPVGVSAPLRFHPQPPMKISKICPKHCNSLGNIDKIKGSVNVAKIEYNLGNINNSEKQSKRPKIRHSKKAYNSCRVWRKFDADAPWQKLGTPRMLMKPVVFEGFWWSQGSKTDYAVRKCKY